MVKYITSKLEGRSMTQCKERKSTMRENYESTSGITVEDRVVAQDV